MTRLKGVKNPSVKHTSKGIIREDSRVKIVSDPNELETGHKNEGWILARKYKRFNLWVKRSRSGEILRECFSRYEIPKRVNVLTEGK